MSDEVQRPAVGWARIDHAAVDRIGQELGAVALAVYVRLARHVNGAGICWPSEQLLGRKVHLTPKTVRKHLRSLRAIGAVVIERRRSKAGVWKGNAYQMIPAIDWKPPVKTTDGTTGKIYRRPPVNNARKPPVTVTDEQEPVLNKNQMNKHVEPEAGSTADLFEFQKPVGKPTERDFLEAGRQVYLYFCEKLGHNPIVYTWTPKRRQMMRQRAREAYGMAVGHYPGLTPAEWLERTTEAMRVAVNNFALSDWHQGRDPKTGGKKYLGVEYCFGSPERMQKWLMGGI